MKQSVALDLEKKKIKKIEWVMEYLKIHNSK